MRHLHFYYFPANGVCKSIPHRVLLMIWGGNKHHLCELVIDNDPHLQMHLQEPFYFCSIQGAWSEIHINPKYIVFKMGALPPNHKTSINPDITKGNLEVRCTVFGKLGVCLPLLGRQLHEDLAPPCAFPRHTWCRVSIPTQQLMPCVHSHTAPEAVCAFPRRTWCRVHSHATPDAVPAALQTLPRQEKGLVTANSQCAPL